MTRLRGQGEPPGREVPRASQLQTNCGHAPPPKDCEALAGQASRPWGLARIFYPVQERGGAVPPRTGAGAGLRPPGWRADEASSTTFNMNPRVWVCLVCVIVSVYLNRCLSAIRTSAWPYPRWCPQRSPPFAPIITLLYIFSCVRVCWRGGRGGYRPRVTPQNGTKDFLCGKSPAIRPKNPCRWVLVLVFLDRLS